MAAPLVFVDLPDNSEARNLLGRRGPSKVVNEFIVGHIYAHLTYDQMATYMRWVYKDFDDITPARVQALWEGGRMANTLHFLYWNSKTIDSPEVRQTLDTMKREWNMWRDLGLEGIMKELGEE